MPHNMRRYAWKLYPTSDQETALHTQRMMVADLWNALLERHETIRRRTVQRQTWADAEGKLHRGDSVHRQTYETIRYKHGERSVVKPGKDGRPKPFSAFDMQNEVTWMLNELPEWRALSCWTALRVPVMLDNAFAAFYRRAKEGASSSSGYPRFKARAKHNSIPHRFASGCKLTRDPRHELSWCLTLKGIPGIIHARGRLPEVVSKWTDADIMWSDGNWWLSAAVEIQPRHHSAKLFPVEIELGVLDGLARVNGHLSIPDDMPAVQALQDHIDVLKSERDKMYPPKPGRRCVEPGFLEMQNEIHRLETLARRRRNNALHVWSAGIVRSASSITIRMPPIRQSTKTARGDQKQWGANVNTVATINRSILSYAPALAAQMLVYKGVEAGIPVIVLKHEGADVAVGGDLVKAGKALRTARRTINQQQRDAA